MKGTAAFLAVARALFPGRRAVEVARDVEERIGALPGLEGLPFFTRFLRRAGAGARTGEQARTGLAAIGGCAP